MGADTRDSPGVQRSLNYPSFNSAHKHFYGKNTLTVLIVYATARQVFLYLASSALPSMLLPGKQCRIVRVCYFASRACTYRFCKLASRVQNAIYAFFCTGSLGTPPKPRNHTSCELRVFTLRSIPLNYEFHLFLYLFFLTSCQFLFVRISAFSPRKMIPASSSPVS